MHDNDQKILQIFSNVLSVPLEEVSIDSKPEDFQNWDSMRHMMLLLTVESELGLNFSDEEMISAGTLSDLIKLVETKREQA